MIHGSDKLEASVDLKSGQIEIEDTFIGKRTLMPGALALVKDQLRVLEHFKLARSSPNPTMLEEDIAVYKYIINGENPEKLAEDYAEYRVKTRHRATKMEVAKALGWKVKVEES